MSTEQYYIIAPVDNGKKLKPTDPYTVVYGPYAWFEAAVGYARGLAYDNAQEAYKHNNKLRNFIVVKAESIVKCRRLPVEFDTIVETLP